MIISTTHERISVTGKYSVSQNKANYIVTWFCCSIRWQYEKFVQGSDPRTNNIVLTIGKKNIENPVWVQQSLEIVWHSVLKKVLKKQ